MKCLTMAMLASLALLPSGAQAADWTTNARVTFVDAGNMPGGITFRIDTPVGNCPAGTFMIWNRNDLDSASATKNNEAMLAVLLIAKSTGQMINIVGDTSGCKPRLIYLV